MLAHSPPLPLVIDYERTDITAEDEEAILLALEQRDRVRRIRLYTSVLQLQKLIMAIDGEYPILEYLILEDAPEDRRTVLILPETLQTPRLRHLAINCSIPIRSPLLGMAAGLVILSLALDHPSTYFQPTILLQSLSLMPQLEILLIFFNFPVPNRDVERQLMRSPIMTHVTLPNLRSFAFQAVSFYSEAVLSRITASRLEDFQIAYPKQLTFSVPELVQFMGRTENLRFDRAEFNFYGERVYVEVNQTNMPVDAFSMNVECWHLDWQVSSVAQIFNALSQIFSAVEHLTLAHEVHSQSSEEHNEVDRTEWRKLLRSFSNVKALRIDDGLIRELSRCLSLEDGEHPLEVLPELQELTYSGSGNANDAFTSFIDARKNAGRPVITPASQNRWERVKNGFSQPVKYGGDAKLFPFPAIFPGVKRLDEERRSGLSRNASSPDIPFRPTADGFSTLSSGSASSRTPQASQPELASPNTEYMGWDDSLRVIVTDATPKKNGEGSQTKWGRVKNAFSRPGSSTGKRPRNDSIQERGNNANSSTLRTNGARSRNNSIRDRTTNTDSSTSRESGASLTGASKTDKGK
jgi:hypothetical protein